VVTDESVEYKAIIEAAGREAAERVGRGRGGEADRVDGKLLGD
jgi:hypothetical protein